MNTEQLHSVIKKLHQAHSQVRTVKRFNAARDALQNVINQPGNPDVQQAYRVALDALRAILKDERLTVFSAKEDDILVETDLYQFTGPALLRNLNDAVDNDNYTPALAIQQLAELNDKLNAQLNRLGGLDQHLTDLNIGYDVVHVNEAQIGFYIPRPSGENLTFAGLIEEEQELDQFVASANEIVIGSRDSPPVKLLTASDYGFLLQLALPVAGFLAVVLERALAARKVWLEGQILKKQLGALDAPAEHIAGLDEHFKNRLNDQIRTGVEQAVSEHSSLSDVGRRNELTNEIVIHVKAFADKANKGHYVDLKIGPPPTTETDPAGNSMVVNSEASLAAVARAREIDLLTRRVHELEHEVKQQRRLASPED